MSDTLPLQTIPNPNRDRLGFPPPQTPEPDGKRERERQAERAHAEAFAYAEQLLVLARQLLGDLRNASTFNASVAAKREAEKIEKLARKLRGRLQD